MPGVRHELQVFFLAPCVCQDIPSNEDKAILYVFGGNQGSLRQRYRKASEDAQAGGAEEEKRVRSISAASVAGDHVADN